MKQYWKYYTFIRTGTIAVIVGGCALFAVFSDKGRKNEEPVTRQGGLPGTAYETAAPEAQAAEAAGEGGEVGGNVAEVDRVGEGGGEGGGALEARGISRDAEIIYEYRYSDETVTIAETAPRFLAGKTKEETAEVFNGFEVVEFAPERVVLRLSIDNLAKSYIIGVWGGRVAVFLDCGEYGAVLRDVTEKPVSALSENEREKISRGVRVANDETLFIALQDYGS